MSDVFVSIFCIIKITQLQLMLYILHKYVYFPYTRVTVAQGAARTRPVTKGPITDDTMMSCPACYVYCPPTLSSLLNTLNSVLLLLPSL